MQFKIDFGKVLNIALEMRAVIHGNTTTERHTPHLTFFETISILLMLAVSAIEPSVVYHPLVSLNKIFAHE